MTKEKKRQRLFDRYKLKNKLRDQSLLMPGRGPEDISRGHEKFLGIKGRVEKS